MPTPPTFTARTTPAGTRLEDGFQATYAFALAPSIAIWEIDVKPPGIDGGDPIDVSTQHDLTWDVMAPRKRKKMTNGGMRVAYDPACLSDINAAINRKDSITIHYPDGSGDAFYGYLKSFERDNLTFGTFPTAMCDIVATNRDASGAMVGPVHHTLGT